MASNFNSFNSIYVMNKIFKCILGVFIIWIWIVNTTNAETIELNNLVWNFICENWDCYVETPIISQPFLWYTGWNINLSCKVNYLATNNCNNTNICFNWINDWNVILDITMQRTNWVMNYLREDSNMDTFNTYYTIINNENIEDYIIDWNIPSNTYATYLMLFPSRPENTTNENNKDGTIWFNCLLSWDFGNTVPSNWSSCPTCPTCEEQYTSLECQTEYNLIPINSITKSYCELNFNLIDPSTCPISEGSWVVNWSSLFINNTQYAWNENIEIFIPDFIWWSIIYNSWSNYIDIEWYNADTEYIENVIDNTKVTPTPEDATLLVNGLAEFIPYVFIAMIISFALILINKLFKS